VDLFTKKYPKTPVVLVETGDFSGDPDEAGDIKTGNLIEGMKRLGYAAVNVGERELTPGVDAFLKRAKESGLAFTNANFIYRDNGEPLFAPYLLQETKLASGRKIVIGYLGLDGLNSAFAKTVASGRVVIMRDPVDAIRLQMPAIRRRADFVVLLANLSLRDLATVLEAAPGVDLVLASNGARLSPGESLEDLGGVPVMYAGDQGKRMGEVRVSFDAKDGARPTLSGNEVWLTRRYPADPGLQTLIDATVARVNEINRRKAATASTPSGSPAAARTRPGGLLAPGGSQKGFRTVNECASCHVDIVESYKRTAHATAFRALVEANQDYNPECVRCHVTGFDSPEGFVNARQTPDLANVQCEACHGNAAEHVADPSRPYGKVQPRQCFVCHTKENSPDFVFFKYWDMIKH